MKIGILTSGGDAPGLNAVIRAAVLKGTRVHGHEFVGFIGGYKGLCEPNIMPLTRHEVKGISQKGGTILGTSRTNPFEFGGVDRVNQVLAEHNIDAIIAIGGREAWLLRKSYRTTVCQSSASQKLLTTT